MFRRRSTDEDESLAEAFRRLDGVSTASSASSPVAASSLAEAARVDAALRGLLQPVGAPDTLAGRVAGEVGRARVLRWRRGSATARRPMWAMAFAGAVVIVLVVGTALATMPGGGTIGERARGVGEWVRAVMGVGARDGRGDGDGSGPVGTGDDAYYWVPGMGILPLAPDAWVSTTPVTVTVGGLDVVIDGLVADRNATRMAVRMVEVEPPAEAGGDQQGIVTLYPQTGEEQFGRNDEGLTCTIRTVELPAQTCIVPPLSPAQRARSDAGFFAKPEHEIGYIRLRTADGADTWNPELRAIRVPVASVAARGLTRAHRMGAPVERGGLKLQGWMAVPSDGLLAVRLEAVSIGPADLVSFTTLDHAENPGFFGVGRADPYDAVSVAVPGQPELHPAAIFTHHHAEGGAAAEFGLRVPKGSRQDPSGTVYRWSLPVTALFAVPAGSGTGPVDLTVGPLLLSVDDESLVERTSLNGPNATTVRLDTVAATYAYSVNLGAAARSDMAVERYPVTNTLRIAARRLPIGFAVVVDPGEPKPADADPDWAGRSPTAMITVHWADAGSDGRQLVDLDIGRVRRGSLWGGLRRECAGFSRGGGHGMPLTGPAPAMWRMVGGPAGEVLPTVTLCLSRPIYQIPGPWTFRLDQP